MPCCQSRFEPLERRVLLAAALPAVFALTEADGTRVTASLAGPGTLQASLAGGQTVLQLDGTTERSTLTVTSDPATGTPTLDSVEVNGSLGRLLAPDAVLAGAVTVSGALRQAALGDVTGQAPATIRIGAGRRTTLTLGRVKDLDIDAPSVAFASVTALSWDDEPADGRQRVVAASVARFSVGMNATNLDLSADRLGAVAVTGDLTDSKIMVLPRAVGAQQGQGFCAVFDGFALVTESVVYPANGLQRTSDELWGLYAFGYLQSLSGITQSIRPVRDFDVEESDRE